MATLTKTFTENESSSYKATWSVSITGQNITVSSDSFTVPTPTAKAKYTYAGKTLGEVLLDVCVGSRYASYKDYGHRFAYQKYGSMSSGTTYSIPLTEKDNLNFSLGEFFDQTNKSSRTANYVAYSYGDGATVVLGSAKGDWVTQRNYYRLPNGSSIQWGAIGTVTIDVPPAVTLGTPTYSQPQYTGIGVYSVPITKAQAYYHGDVSSVTLTVGVDSVTQTYSEETITNKVISLTPSVAGTYTPTITVTDSRGQTTTESLPSITVNAYNVPSVNFDVYRTNSSGIKDDEGHYGLIEVTANYTSGATHLVEPTVEIDGTDVTDIIGASVTWYSASPFTSATEISDWEDVADGATVYGLIDANYASSNIFSESTSYQVTLIAEDGYNQSQPITQTLSTAFYTIDFQAGGKEIAFGAPANDDLTSYQNGLFKCDMDAVFNGDLTATGDTEIENPYFSIDTTAASGTTDGDLYAAITALGWQNDVIE